MVQTLGGGFCCTGRSRKYKTSVITLITTAPHRVSMVLGAEVMLIGLFVLVELLY